jgi:hypothetical protein
MLNLLISEEGLEPQHHEEVYPSLPEEGDDEEVPAREHQGEDLVQTDHGGCILWRYLQCILETKLSTP